MRHRTDYRSTPEARAAFEAAANEQARLGPVGSIRQGGGECAAFWHEVALRLGITDCAAKERARLWGLLGIAPRFPRPLPYRTRLDAREARRKRAAGIAAGDGK